MDRPKSNREVEIKLSVPDAVTGRRLLEMAGFEVVRDRVFESNVVYDTAEGELRQAGKLLRVRQVADHVILTYKGPSEPSKHKSREELELELSDCATFHEILARLCMAPTFRYEKYRTEYQAPGTGGVATLDETPIGVYLELEGSPDWIDRTAEKLGFGEEHYITASYGRLYFERHPMNGTGPAQMTFEAAAADS